MFYQDLSLDDPALRAVAQVLDIDCATVDGDEFGQVLHASLKLRTRCRKVTVTRDDVHPFPPFRGPRYRPDTDESNAVLFGGRKCVVAMIMRVDYRARALVLVANDDGTYRREGLLDFFDVFGAELRYFDEDMELEIV